MRYSCFHASIFSVARESCIFGIAVTTAIAAYTAVRAVTRRPVRTWQAIRLSHTL